MLQFIANGLCFMTILYYEQIKVIDQQDVRRQLRPVCFLLIHAMPVSDPRIS